MNPTLSLVSLVLVACVAAPATGKIPTDGWKLAGNVHTIQQIEAENFDYQIGVLLEDCEDVDGGLDVYGCEEGDVVGYYNVNFRNGLVLSHFRVAADVGPGVAGQMLAHVDNTTTDPFLVIDIENTGGRQNWVTLELHPIVAPTGVHDIFFTFVATSDIHNCAFNWFSLDTSLYA